MRHSQRFAVALSVRKGIRAQALSSPILRCLLARSSSVKELLLFVDHDSERASPRWSHRLVRVVEVDSKSRRLFEMPNVHEGDVVN